MNDEFSRALRPVKARLRRNRFLRGLAFGLLAGLAAALAVRILSLWIPLERKELWTLLPLPACGSGRSPRWKTRTGIRKSAACSGRTPARRCARWT